MTAVSCRSATLSARVPHAPALSSSGTRIPLPPSLSMSRLSPRFHPPRLSPLARVRASRRASPPARSAVAGPRPPAPSRPTLYDVPVSNNGARVRLLMYWKGLDMLVDVVDPGAIGGIKSEAYLALNPQGKMPTAHLPSDLALPESEVIAQYLLHAFEQTGPKLIPEDPEVRAIAALATRIHDQYLAPIQGCMYRGPMDVEARADGISQIAKQMDVLESVAALTKNDGPFLAGAERSFADAALFPTWVFIEYILPKHFGWRDAFEGRPNLSAWFDAMRADDAAARVYDEVRGGLEAWEESGRWAKVGVEEHVKDDRFEWAPKGSGI